MVLEPRVHGALYAWAVYARSNVDADGLCARNSQKRSVPGLCVDPCLGWVALLSFAETGPGRTRDCLALTHSSFFYCAGLPGGLVSGALFQGPGLLILSALGWALADTLAKSIGWLNGLVSGLAAAGIALVAGAAVNLNKKINSTRELQVISTTSAVIAFYWPKPYVFKHSLWYRDDENSVITITPHFAWVSGGRFHV